MCTYCGQHCVEDEPYRLSPEEIKTGKKVPENTCPGKQDREDTLYGFGATGRDREDIMDSLEEEAYE